MGARMRSPRIGCVSTSVRSSAGERAGLGEDSRRDPDLPDVVEERAELEALQLVRLEPELLADLQREVGDPACVRRGVLVVGLERVRERLDGGEERALQRLVARRRLEGEPRLSRDAREQLELAILGCRAHRDGGGDDAPAAVDEEGCDGEPALGASGHGGDRRVVLRVDRVRLGATEPGLDVLGRDADDTRVVRSSLRVNREPLERAVGALQPDGGAGALEDAGGAARDAFGHVRDVRCFGEVSREGEEGLRALGLPALRLVEPRVLERDGRVSCQHLEQPQVVCVELVEPELRDHDHAGDARAVLERDREQRLLDLGGSLDLLAELVLGGVVDEE